MASVGLVYILVYFLDQEFALAAFNDFGQMIFRIAPAIILVFGVMFLVNFFITAEVVKKNLGKASGKKGLVYSLLASSFVTAPPYVLFPLLRDLKKAE